MLNKILILLNMIKFEHTIFALPFALSSALIASNGFPKWSILLYILIAMVGARSAAMAFNRIIDSSIDAKNPRTSDRAIPKGLISIFSAWIFTIISAALLIFSAYMLNKLAFFLSPVALFCILVYSYTKRFTSLSHFWLGLALGIAPVGAWIAVKAEIGFPSMVLSAAVICWTAGFDIIYSLQDIEFDKKSGLFSIPAKLGSEKALLISRLLHVLMILLLIWFGLLCKLGSAYYIGSAFVAASLIYEQKLVKADDISRVNQAFFTMNGLVSIGMLAFVILDVYFK